MRMMCACVYVCKIASILIFFGVGGHGCLRATFHSEGSGDQTWVARRDGKCLYLTLLLKTESHCIAQASFELAL